MFDYPPPPSLGTPPATRGLSRWLPWAAGACAVGLAVSGLVVVVRYAPKQHDLEYAVSSDATTGSVEYLAVTSSGEASSSGGSDTLDLPWSTTVQQPQRLTSVTLTANAYGGSHIQCSITVDGTVLDAKETLGPSAFVTCTATLASTG